MRILDKAKIPYTPYYYATEDGKIDGISVAQKMGQDPATVFKTLVAISKTKELFVFIIPVARELDLKKAAACAGEKKIEMLKAKELLGLTGYIHGGCSPIGMKKIFPTFIDKSAAEQETICFSGGKIGFQVQLSLEDLKKVIRFELADIVEE